ncbi:MAG: DNA-binding transcriptional LysR family regulator [Psychromonas sp.]|jgi:DNA-binding transcriptional LysR family regulator|uniref:LysR family transcriptional regulator n=1 Tax=Psychromonas sp. TaxID=1884585 RepID=UPI0039E6C3BF
MLRPEILAFLAVVKTGSFTRAAEQTKTSKSRVSQQVSSLEKTLGITLLHRSTRKIRLTDAGDSYYSECARAAAILEQARKNLNEQQDQVAGLIRLNSVGGLFSENMLAPAVIAFMQQYPDVEIQLDFSSAQVDVIAENVDLVVRMGQLNDSALIARKLMEIKTDVVASPAFIKKQGKPNQPQQLAQFNCLCGSLRKWHFQHKSSEQVQDVTVTGSLSSANGHILCRAAIEGVGIVRLNELYTDQYIQTGKLVSIFEQWQIPSSPVSLIYPKVRYKTKRIQVFVDFLIAWFENK